MQHAFRPAPPNKRLIRVVLLVLFGGGYSSASAAGPWAHGDLTACLTRVIQQQHEIDLSKKISIREACPQIEAFSHSQLGRNLEPRTGKTLTLGQVIDLRHLLQKPVSHSPDDHSPKLDALVAIQKEVYAPIAEKKAEPGYWQRFLEWLRQRFGSESDKPGWLGKLIDKIDIPKDTAQAIFKGSVAVLLIMAAYLLYHELRAASISNYFKQRRLRRQHQPGVAAHTVAHRTLTDVMQLSGRDRISALFQYLVDRLFQTQDLSNRDSLTNAELCQQLAMNSTLQQGFEHVIKNVEPILYGSHAPDDTTTASVETLILQLDTQVGAKT